MTKLLEIFHGYHARRKSEFVIESDSAADANRPFEHYRCDREFTKLIAWLGSKRRFENSASRAAQRVRQSDKRPATVFSLAARQLYVVNPENEARINRIAELGRQAEEIHQQQAESVKQLDHIDGTKWGLRE